MEIALINESSMVSNSDVAIMSSALQIQLTLHVAPAFRMQPPIVKFYTNKLQVPGYAWIMSILDTPDVANALGYHEEQNDHPDGFVFCQPVLSNGGVILYDATNPQNVSVSSVCSHEGIELFADRFANLWADNGSTSWAYELCDPVQGFSYAINVNGTMVSMSDFIFQSFFNPQAKSPDNLPFDYMKQLSTPFTIAKNGYAIQRTDGNATQVFGEKMPQWVKEMKQQQFSRLTKRSVNCKKSGFFKRLFG